MFHYYRELNSWVLTPLWHGLEAPDYDRRLPGTLAYETDQMATGPYRSQLFLKSKTSHTKDLEIEMSSFLSEDDGVTSFLDTYRANLKQFAAVMTLDGMAPLLPRLFSFLWSSRPFSPIFFLLSHVDKKDNFFQISTLEGVSKRIRVTNEMTGQQLVSLFASKIGMTNFAFFQLSAVTDGCGAQSFRFIFSLFIHYQTNNELQ